MSAICGWPLSHRDKHNCSCICAREPHHKGAHACQLELDAPSPSPLPQENNP